MKRSVKAYVLVFAAVSDLTAVIVVERRPPPLASVVERVFGYQLKEEPMTVKRTWKKSWWPQGVAYHEETTVRLSAVDYRDLLTHLTGDHSFKKKKVGSNEFNERFVVGRELIDWQSYDAKQEVWYSYREY